ncbi:hypothetical protein FisN_24Lh149 [Fistulifera solaris]|uniref:Kinesin light chain n=1 Tax=Fistulifera solaris TaxID=1519565 RepID=A0A1Z5K9N6_FISSO|nr:hypothetical protein FisN_24Lh149 [Fistulifera solaris]|eukprot:GAX22862.1 hypothetical protein FisN_24Lh149 [Fistulifera solaris]
MNIPLPNSPIGQAGHILWIDELETGELVSNSRNNGKASSCGEFPALSLSSNHSKKSISFLPKELYGMNVDNADGRDDETNTTQDELRSTASSVSESCLFESVDDDAFCSPETTESDECCHASIEQRVELLLERTSELFDREIVHRNAAFESTADVTTSPQIPREEDVINHNVSPEQLWKQGANITHDCPNEEGATTSSSLSSVKEPESSRIDVSCEHTQQAEKQQNPSVESPDQHKSIITSAEIFADLSDFSSSESPLDSLAAIEPSFAGFLSTNSFQNEFQRIVDDASLAYPLDHESTQPVDPTNGDEAGFEMILSRSRPSVRRARILVKWGSLQLKRGRLDAAIGVLALSVKDVRALKKKDVAIALAANLLGIAFKKKKDWRKAICCFQESFLIRQRELGKQHVDTIDSLNHLGSSLLHLGDARGALKCFREVFWSRKSIFGATHPGVALASHDLANVLVTLGNYNEARKFYLTAWVIYHKLPLHKNHPSIIRLVQDIENLKEMKRGARAAV